MTIRCMLKAMNCRFAALLLAFAMALSPQKPDYPRGMHGGGNQLIDMGLLEAARVEGTVTDSSGYSIPRARIQLQLQGSGEIVREMEADDKGYFRLPRLRRGTYWLGISAPGMNLNFWDLRIGPWNEDA
jgi:hypothetical protein